jgi:mRNA-degrading endonuclease RelE of RelBE toxin-antitoxin system
MIEIVYKPTFIRQYKRFPKDLQEEIKERISLVQQDPRHRFLKTHKLKGQLHGFINFSVNYQYRMYVRNRKACCVACGWRPRRI